MARQCMRPGCDQPVVAHVTMDPAGAAVWIDSPSPEPGQAQQLCHIHAESLAVPMGWTVTDRRGGPVLLEADTLSSGDEAAADAHESAGDEGDHGSDAVEESVSDIPAEDDRTDEDDRIEDDGGGDRTDDDTPSPTRRTRRGRRPIRSGGAGLLEQAIASSGHQRSVLTQPPVPPPQD